MSAAPKSKTVTSQDFARCSNALTNGLARTGARALAVALVRKRAPRRRELAGASAGASVAFTNLCIALAEAPAGTHMHEIDVIGVGRVSWKAAPMDGDADSDLVVFALHEEKEELAAPASLVAEALVASR